MNICAWQSADGRVASDHFRVTVQWHFSKKFQIAWNVKKTLFDSRPTVAWPPTTIAWPFSDLFQNIFKLLETSKKHCLTVGRRSRDLRPLSRDRSVTFFKKISNCLKRPKNVVWQSADGRVTSDHYRVTVQWPFSKHFQIAWNVQKTLFDSRPTVAWPPTTVAWPFSDFFSKIFLNAWNVQKTLFDSHPTVAWPPTTVAWPSVTFFKISPNRLKRLKNVVWQSSNGRMTSDHCRVTFSDFFLKFSELLETSKKRCLTVGRWSRDLRPLSRDFQWLFSKNFRIACNV